MRPLAVSLLLCFFLPVVLANEVLLFDSSIGTTPGMQAWIEGPPGPYSSHNGQGVVLDTSTSHSVRYGYATEDLFLGIITHPNVPALDRGEQFSIEFELQVQSEAHELADRNNDGLSDRAGFSFIVISQDLLGIELGFFTDRVWAQESGFFQAESGLWETQLLNQYRLSGDSNGYLLEAKNANNRKYVTVLSGPWRNYNPSGISDPFLDPYNNPSLLFLGDNTTSASATVVLGDVMVRTGPLPYAMVKTVPVPFHHIILLFVVITCAALNRLPASPKKF